MTFKTPRATAAGLGSAHHGTHHWWMHRLTSLALIPLTLLFVIPFGAALGDSREAVIALYSQPIHAVIALLFIGVTFHHHHAGLQVVIQDYIHDKMWLPVALALNWMICGAAGLAGVFAVLKIAFTG